MIDHDPGSPHFRELHGHLNNHTNAAKHGDARSISKGQLLRNTMHWAFDILGAFDPAYFRQFLKLIPPQLLLEDRLQHPLNKSVS